METMQQPVTTGFGMSSPRTRMDSSFRSVGKSASLDVTSTTHALSQPGSPDGSKAVGPFSTTASQKGSCQAPVAQPSALRKDSRKSSESRLSVKIAAPDPDDNESENQDTATKQSKGFHPTMQIPTLSATMPTLRTIIPSPSGNKPVITQSTDMMTNYQTQMQPSSTGRPSTNQDAANFQATLPTMANITPAPPRSMSDDSIRGTQNAIPLALQSIPSTSGEDPSQSTPFTFFSPEDQPEGLKEELEEMELKRKRGEEMAEMKRVHDEKWYKVSLENSILHRRMEQLQKRMLEVQTIHKKELEQKNSQIAKLDKNLTEMTDKYNAQLKGMSALQQLGYGIPERKKSFGDRSSIGGDANASYRNYQQHANPMQTNDAMRSEARSYRSACSPSYGQSQYEQSMAGQSYSSPEIKTRSTQMGQGQEQHNPPHFGQHEPHATILPDGYRPNVTIPPSLNSAYETIVNFDIGSLGRTMFGN